MSAFASLSIASALSVASLNLCADEYLLLLAKPDEISSVTFLAKDRHESPLWKRARPYPANRGSIEDVVALGPKVVLTMGGGGKASGLIAQRLGMKIVDLPFPATIADVEANMRRVATALGEPARASKWSTRLARLKATRPSSPIDAIYVGHGGTSIAPGSPGIGWLELAGLAQRPLRHGRVTLEQLLTDSPRVLVRSDYRSGQMSSGARWFDHPIVKRLDDRTIRTDGRRWTCAGPLMLDEVVRLRKLRP